MLSNLSIRNIVLIDSAEVSFTQGLCVLTGETGAGKSILLDSLGLTLGRKAESGLIRNGEEQGTVIAEFDISDNEEAKKLLEEEGLPNDDNLLLRRVLYADGKSRAFVNDAPVSVNLLQEIGARLVEVHGQHDQRGLLNTASHIKLLDAYGNLEAERKKVRECYTNWKNAEKEYLSTKEETEKASKEQDYLQFVVNELETLDVKSGEEAQLTAQRILLMNSGKIAEALNSALDELQNKVDIQQSIRSAERIMERNSALADEKFVKIIESLDRAAIEVGEAVAEIENIISDINISGSDLEPIEDRLFTIKAISRKYSKPSDELAEYLNEIMAKLQLIESQDKKLGALFAIVERSREEFKKYAALISKERKKCADKLEKAVLAELAPLRMSGTKFKVNIENIEEAGWSTDGYDKVNFLVSTNTGTNFGPINKIASGGELSRFMLALRVVLAGTKSAPTMVFDEIDTGVGGAVADAVGKRLSKLSDKIQIICVTHQPQVASYGAHHIRISKKEKAGEVKTIIEMLDDKNRKEEIARMLAGEKVTEEARAAAGKLLQDA